MAGVESMTLLQLQQTVTRLVTVPETQQVWITAELSDVAVRGGHCYMELLQKDPATGVTQARARAVIWANIWSRLAAYFKASTGQDFATGIKVMVRVSVSYHPVYGMNLVISSVNPEYTMGDLMRRRREILQRLEKEGLLNRNRSLQWPVPVQRIAVVSAPGAAGYGDFINQLYHNPYRLKFHSRLFPAVMQGDKAPASILAALRAIDREAGQWDCVVVIRGGGSTSDLAAFEDYALAAAMASCSVPVIVGIGHERDVTVLDYVANMRVKTPTAAAEWLIAKGAAELDGLRRISTSLHKVLTERVNGNRTQLSFIEGQLPAYARRVLSHSSQKLQMASVVLKSVSPRYLTPQRQRLDMLCNILPQSVDVQMKRHARRLDSCASLIEALSPTTVLRRGFSITKIGDTIVRNASDVQHGAVLTTVFVDGKINSTVD